MTIRICLSALVATGVFAGAAFARPYPDIFDPLQLRTLNLQMSNADWQTIQHDLTFDIEVPTMMWLDGEEPILVSIRRKSADALTEAQGFDKVSYKVDINELVPDQNWHGLRKLSLENGDDVDVLSEGLAWQMHKMASVPEGYGYQAGYASWVRLIINGVDNGVYVNAEQRDKRFLQNRGLWVEGETWLYEIEDVQGYELDEGGPADSPTLTALCYAPFASPSLCPTPDAATLAADLPSTINMRGLLALAAVDTLTGNPDALFTNGKNFYIADYLSGAPRLHFPWDLDASLGGGEVNANIYAPRSAYSNILLGVPEFREQYSRILNELVCGPLHENALHALINAIEPVLSDALADDPNNQFGDDPVDEVFAKRKQWVSNRIANVISQIDGFTPCVNAICRADLDIDNAVDGADLAMLLASWGTTDLVADISGDGAVDGVDLAAILSSWGGCVTP